jgi:hypothetical protein
MCFWDTMNSLRESSELAPGRVGVGRYRDAPGAKLVFSELRLRALTKAPEPGKVAAGKADDF